VCVGFGAVGACVSNIDVRPGESHRIRNLFRSFRRSNRNERNGQTRHCRTVTYRRLSLPRCRAYDAGRVAGVPQLASTAILWRHRASPAHRCRRTRGNADPDRGSPRRRTAPPYDGSTHAPRYEAVEPPLTGFRETPSAQPSATAAWSHSWSELGPSRVAVGFGRGVVVQVKCPEKREQVTGGQHRRRERGW
jgi:hypothetical protein